jgi:hypothetical protein
VSSTGQTINLKFEVPKLVLLERSLKLLISVTEVQILLHASKQWQIKDPLIQERALLSSFLLAHFFFASGASMGSMVVGGLEPRPLSSTVGSAAACKHTWHWSSLLNQATPTGRINTFHMPM